MEQRNFKIIIEEKKTQDGKKFNTYKTVTKNGRYIQVKFRKEVKNLPTENCVAVISEDAISFDKNREFPVMWVAEVQEYKPLDTLRTESTKKTLADLFD